MTWLRSKFGYLVAVGLGFLLYLVAVLYHANVEKSLFIAMCGSLLIFYGWVSLMTGMKDKKE